ncbi:hypothetical protein CesoFtcFv8_027126 [Champsocephalus esox]|uniref:Uncharacterized protein n=1 Tax=Champsocephalus esox TaxID=159716 RepID=A0AAN8G8Y1_9TELE|nr:hypothetical protein CesoFtcFv8_027126 [Champsocephalus esox]
MSRLGSLLFSPSSFPGHSGCLLTRLTTSSQLEESDPVERAGPSWPPPQLDSADDWMLDGRGDRKGENKEPREIFA